MDDEADHATDLDLSALTYDLRGLLDAHPTAVALPRLRDEGLELPHRHLLERGQVQRTERSDGTHTSDELRREAALRRRLDRASEQTRVLPELESRRGTSFLGVMVEVGLGLAHLIEDLRAGIGRHDDVRVQERRRTAVLVGQTPVIENLQQQTHDILVSLLHLVAEQDRVRTLRPMPGQLGLEAIHRRLQRELRHVEDPQVAPRISEQDLRDLLRHLRIVRDHELTGLIEVLLAGDVDARGALGTIQLLDRLDPDHVELLHTRTTSRLERRTLSDPALALKAEDADLVLVADPDVNVMLDAHPTLVTSTRLIIVRTRPTKGAAQP